MKVSEEIIEVMDALCEKLGIAVKWTSDTVIPVIQDITSKYIRWEISTSVLWIVVFILGIIGAILAIRWMYKNPYDTTFAELTCVCTVVAIVGCFVGILVNVLDIIKCITFPELQLYEYINQTILPK